MRKYYFLALLLALSFSTFYSCGSDYTYTEIPQPEPEPEPEPGQESPVVMDITAVPYAKLSDYNFFEGPLKNLTPVYRVIPYDLNSSLFTDYASKKRFIWMPGNVKASYTTDANVLDFPTGTVLIKNFYYDNVQPSNTTFIIETRLMIKKDSGWIFANYIWNDEQTEAYLDTEGNTIRMSWMQNGSPMTTDYKIPSLTECATCHMHDAHNTPIGTKPQNLNKLYAYATGSMNQLSKWIETGYLNSNIPSSIVSTVDWTDQTKSLDLRVRSYLDINCAHCHSEGTFCDYTPMNLAFNKTLDPVNLGICVEPMDFAPNGESYLIAGQQTEESLIYFRMSTDISFERMPFLGTTVVHTEAVLLMEEWINSLPEPCP